MASGSVSKDTKFYAVSALFLVIILGQTSRVENQDGLVHVYWLSLLLKLLLPLIVSIYGVRKGSLDSTGGLLAFVVGVVHSIAGCRFSYSMITFFVLGSRLSKWRINIKQTFEASEDSGATRNWRQVFCNGVVSSIALAGYIYSDNDIVRQYYFGFAALSAISCCCGDTFASEFGSVVNSRPRLITTLRHVPRGTNGGVSLAGTLASVVGGLLVGLVFYVTQYWTLEADNVPFLLILTTSVFGGLFGSLIDSLLGATLQYSGYDFKTHRISHTSRSNVQHISGRDILTNNQVNLISSLITAILVPCFVIIGMKTFL